MGANWKEWVPLANSVGASLTRKENKRGLASKSSAVPAEGTVPQDPRLRAEDSPGGGLGSGGSGAISSVTDR